ncbi:hypothetical protein PanWU01x14_064080 [Parasponia andersonii]|uniref:Uncharacterized protein n=1 Tax=Parasponia andersonii TaxID=3476 RepID=A0A2P5DH63_PARAD|nr:hypothetical protein PanWU01x14_064080 [Parasponia andersonii]
MTYTQWRTNGTDRTEPRDQDGAMDELVKQENDAEEEGTRNPPPVPPIIWADDRGDKEKFSKYYRRSEI